MYEKVCGFRFKVVIKNGNKQYNEFIVVKFDGIETEEQAVSVAIGAIRNGYPIGTIDFIEVESGKWCPTGNPANEAGTAIWCS